MDYRILLYTYFEEGLDATTEQSLFQALSHDAELRQTFNDLRQMESLVSADRRTIAPPPRVTTAVFSALNIPPPMPLHIPVPIAHTPIERTDEATPRPWRTLMLAPLLLLWETKIQLAAAALLCAVGCGAFYWLGLQQQSGVQQNTVQNSNAPYTAQMLNNGSSLSNNNAETSHPARSVHRNVSNKAINNNNDGQSWLSSTQTTVNAESILADSVSAEQPTTAISPVSSVSSSLLPMKVLPIASIQAPQMIGTTDATLIAESASIFSRLSVSVRGIGLVAISLPEAASIHNDSWLKNVAAGVFYNFSEYHAIGIEAGREAFSHDERRHDASMQNDDDVHHFDSEVFFWYGLSYRFTAPQGTLFGVLTPFAQATAAVSEHGFIGRTSFGIRYSLSEHWHIMGGVEGSLLRGDDHGRRDYSGKAGATLGIEFKF